ncbi:MAG: hypothetical protein H7Y04_08150 [Verrucomicrobia bacterium]|nr:hypothetical protein [Cytophagales bacterium]
MNTRAESSNRNKAFIISVLLHVLLLIMAWLVVFYPPDPPLSERGGGVELNFGTDDFGNGDVQSLEIGGADNNTKNENTTLAATEEIPEEITDKSEPTPDPELTEENSENVVEVKKEEPKKELPKTEKKETPKKEVKKQEITPKTDSKSLMTKKSTSAEGKNTGGNANEGNDPGKTGNKGKTEGDLNGRAYFGKKGSGGGNTGGSGGGDGNGNGGGGASMNVPGWKWTKRPDPKENSDETGKIVFTVKIDDEGNVLSCTVREATVSPSVIAVYKKELLENTQFQPDNTGTPAPVSTGTITFIIKSK